MQKSKFSLLIATLAAMAAPMAAHAEAPVFTSLTGAVDFSTVGTAILAVGALVVVPIVVTKGTRWVLGMIKRG